jgi:hypothetical protein
MGSHDKHLPSRPFSKATNPDDTRGLSRGTIKRIARGNALRAKEDARKARQGDRR